MRLEFPPRSLSVRLFLLLLLGGMLTAVSITTLLAIHERERLVQSFRDQALADRIADFLHLLAALPPEQRLTTVRALPSGLWSIDATSAAEFGAAAPAPTPFAQALAAAAGEGIKIEAASRIIRKVCMGEVEPCLPKVVVSVWADFPEGQKVHIEGIRESAPPYLPKSFQFAINLSILAGLLAVMAWFAVHLVLQPLRSLSEAAEAFGRDPEGPPIKETGPSEVRQAVQALNWMRERLRAHIEERTHILAAITHDLKTPLTRMRLRLEQCEDEPLRARLAEDIDAMKALVAEGLDLARSLDTEQPPLAVDLGALLSSICDDVVETGGKAAYEGPESALSCGMPEALRRVFLNLIDNAVKYGGGAKVSLGRSDNQWLVNVRDSGPGIPAQYLEDVMKPFFRLESSRSRETGGTGLGLSIAANLLMVQGGKLSLGNPPDGGLEARVILPATRSVALD